MEKTYYHKITYDFDGTASIRDVVNSLLANERFVKEAIGILDECHPNLKIEGYDVKLAEVSQQSPLKELIAVSLVIAFQKDLEEEVPDFIQAITGLNVPDQYDSMITVIVVAVALYGGLSLIERVFKNKTSSPKMRESYANVTHVAGNLIQVPPETLRDTIEERLGGSKKRAIAKSAKDFFEPAKTLNARAIKAGTDLKIEADAISEIPSDVDEALIEPVVQEYELINAVVKLRAHDLDSEKTGWAGIIESETDQRVKVHIDEAVSSERLFGKKQVDARVRVSSREDDSGKMKPYLYVIQEVYRDDT